jgi:hypothetical protein
MAEGLSVILSNQSFAEAGGTQAYPHLEMMSMVFCPNGGGMDEHLKVDRKKALYEKLSSAALSLGATYVFKVECLSDGIQGTPYRLKENTYGCQGSCCEQCY